MPSCPHDKTLTSRITPVSIFAMDNKCLILEVKKKKNSLGHKKCISYPSEEGKGIGPDCKSFR